MRGAPLMSGAAAQRGAFASITTLFFAWGFITASIDPLIAALKAIFSLSYREAALTPFAFFIAYGVVSLPAAGIVRRAGYPASIVLALLIMICGCLLIPVATHFETFAIVLVALFIIASGITILQVAANPLAAELGAPAGAHFRLTFSQAFNSLGTTIAPFLVASLVLAGGMFAAQAGVAATAAQRTESLGHIDTAFFGIAILIALLAFFIWRVRGRLEAAAPLLAEGEDDSIGRALRSRWALLGALAIFLYVGAEVSIGSYLTNFLNQPDVFGVPLEKAGRLVSFYWGGAMVGRFIGSALLRRINAGHLLGAAAACAALLCLIVRLAPGEAGRGGVERRAHELHHVSGDLHPHARALERLGVGDLGPAVHGDHRWRSAALHRRPHRRRHAQPAPRVRRAARCLPRHQRLRLCRGAGAARTAPLRGERRCRLRAPPWGMWMPRAPRGSCPHSFAAG